MPSTIPDGLWVDNNVDAGEFRKALGVGLVLPGGAGAVPRPGRLIGPSSAGTVPLQVTPTGPASMAVLVKAGKAVTYRSAAYGPIVGVGPDGDVTIPIPAAPASGSQWHRVYLIQRDTAAPASDSTAGAVVDVVSGTAASTPVAPTVPAGGLLLGDVIVPAGALTVTAAYITDRPAWTSTRGGILPVASQAERVALPAWPTARAQELDTGRALRYDGAVWRYDGDYLEVANRAALDALTPYAGLRARTLAGTAAAPSAADQIPNTYRHNGAAWVADDTNLLPITLGAALAAGGTGVGGGNNYRVRNGLCYVNLDIQYGGTWGAGYGVTAVPLPLPAAYSNHLGGFWASTAVIQLRLNTTGIVTVQTAVTGSAGMAASFSYPVAP